MAELQFHPVASIFPLMEGFEYDRLVLDIKNKGLKEDIWTYDGQIIDGRNRYRACKQAKVKPRFREWDGEGSLVEFVFSLNYHRRHLNASQAAMIGAGLAKNLEDEAAERQRAGTKPDLTANLQQPPAGRSAAQAAAATGVSERSVASAIKVTEQCDKSVVEAVTAGEVSVSDAAKVAELPKAEQRKALAKVESGKSPTLAAAAKATPPKPPPTNASKSKAFDESAGTEHLKKLRWWLDARGAKFGKLAHWKNAIAQFNELAETVEEWRGETGGKIERVRK